MVRPASIPGNKSFVAGINADYSKIPDSTPPDPTPRCSSSRGAQGTPHGDNVPPAATSACRGHGSSDELRASERHSRGASSIYTQGSAA